MKGSIKLSGLGGKLSIVWRGSKHDAGQVTHTGSTELWDRMLHELAHGRFSYHPSEGGAFNASDPDNWIHLVAAARSLGMRAEVDDSGVELPMSDFIVPDDRFRHVDDTATEAEVMRHLGGEDVAKSFTVKVARRDAKARADEEPDHPYQGVVDFQGLKIHVENRKGSTRRGDGWSTKMGMHYGEIRGTKGADGDPVDVFVGPDHESSKVVVVHQKRPGSTDYDEDKCILGFRRVDDALAAYREHYDRPGFYGGHTVMTLDEFRAWLDKHGGKGRRIAKGGGPYIGPRGGKWADPQHKIPWREGAVKRARKPVASAAEAKTGVPFSGVAYHGTAADFDEQGGIKEAQSGGRFRGLQVPHDGIWFAEKMSSARTYAVGGPRPRVIEAKISMQNPYVYSAEEHADEGISSLPDLYRLRQAGHDGVIVQRAEWDDSSGDLRLKRLGDHYVVFDSDQADVSKAVQRDLFGQHKQVADAPSAKQGELGIGKKHPPIFHGPRGGAYLDPAHKHPAKHRNPHGDKLKHRAIVKGGGPYIGPRGGKWADPQHKIPWKVEATTHKTISGADEHGKETFHAAEVEGGHVRLSRDAHSPYGPVMPKESVKHFLNDLAGKVDLPRHKSNADINAVIDGKAKILGKGDDGIAFKVGDKVVKVSTTVPFQPMNQGHRSPADASKMLREQVEIADEMAAAGVKGIQRSKFVEHGDKGFQIKGYVEIPDKLTREQLDEAQDIIISMHKAGYSLNDTVQVGLENGKLVLFDVGKAEKLPDDDESKGLYSRASADRDRLRTLYRDNGHEYVRKDMDEGEAAWKKATDDLRRMLKMPKLVTARGTQPSFAAMQIKRAADKRRAVARVKHSGDALKRVMEAIGDDESFAIMEIEWAAEDHAKGAKDAKGIAKAVQRDLFGQHKQVADAPSAKQGELAVGKKRSPLFHGPRGGAYLDPAHKHPAKHRNPHGDKLKHRAIVRDKHGDLHQVEKVGAHAKTGRVAALVRTPRGDRILHADEVKVHAAPSDLFGKSESVAGYPKAGRNAPAGVRSEVAKLRGRTDKPLLYLLLGSGTPDYKMSKQDADYTDRSTTKGQTCGNCEFIWRQDDRVICSQVRGEIKPAGWCKLWVKQ